MADDMRALIHTVMDRQVNELVVASTMMGQPASRAQLEPMLHRAMKERAEAIVRRAFDQGVPMSEAFAEELKAASAEVLRTVTTDPGEGVQ